MLPTTYWKLSKPDIEKKNILTKELGINPVTSQVLINRGLTEADEARSFLFPSLKDLHNPFLLKDMAPAVDRTIGAIQKGEQITVYGDYDADGITSTALLVKFLRDIHRDVSYYIPDRISEGYGLNTKAIDKIKGTGSSLIISVDCGISDREEVRHAQSEGIDVIVLDHHEVPPVIPDCVAVINPNRDDCTFPFRYLAGVGVAFNFIIALRGKLRGLGFWKDGSYPNLRDYMDLVALGTIGDLSPLVDENRIFAKIGLDIINEGKRTGLVALRRQCGLEDDLIDSEAASFNLIPRINAAGRVGTADSAVRLLLTDDRDEAATLASRLDAYNRERQNMERSILDEILHLIDSNDNGDSANSFVFASPRWHPGVIGIVCSKIVDIYYRPTILISLRNGIGKGSGRSIGDFNLYDGLKGGCASHLLTYGGHRYAAGISIREEDIDAFTRCFRESVTEACDDSSFVRKTVIDAECTLQDINYDLISQIEILSPFGSNNPEPVLSAKNVSIGSIATVGNNHLKMQLRGDGVSYDSIWFSRAQYSNALSGSVVDVAFTPQINNWRGSSTIQLKLKDIAIAEKS